MSDGKTHVISSLVLAGGFSIASIATLDVSGLLYSVGSIVGIMLSPDLDVDAKNISSTIVRKRVGWFAEKLWDYLWYWYRRSLKHGSPLSHFPIIGTLGRISYLFFFIIVIPELVIEVLFPTNLDLMLELSWWFRLLIVNYKIILGLMSSDIIHWFLDIATTEHK